MKQNVKVLVSYKMGNSFLKKLEEKLKQIKKYRIELITPETKEKELLKDLIKDVDILLAGIADVDLLKNGKNLKFIQALTSSVARIDLKYTSERDIPVCSAKGPESVAVAEHTLMLMLMLVKNAKENVSLDKWLEKRNNSIELHGKKVGILGAGCIGKEIARMLKGMKMETYGIDKYPSKSSNFDHILNVEKIDKILPKIDFLTIHVPRTKETTNMISLPQMKKMKPESYLINVSRGQVVNLDDLEFALSNKIIKGAALDVFPQEPPDYSHPIFRCENFIYTPHLAGLTVESRIRLADFVAKNIENFLSKKQIVNLVNTETGF